MESICQFIDVPHNMSPCT